MIASGSKLGARVESMSLDRSENKRLQDKTTFAEPNEDLEIQDLGYICDSRLSFGNTDEEQTYIISSEQQTSRKQKKTSNRTDDTQTVPKREI